MKKINYESMLHMAWDHIHYYHVNKSDEWMENRVLIGEHDEHTGEFKKVSQSSSFYGYEETIRQFLLLSLIELDGKIRRFSSAEGRDYARFRLPIPEEVIEASIFDGLYWDECTEAMFVFSKESGEVYLSTVYPV